METPHRTPNALLASSSPYLLQHAYNPVQWLPWGDEAWARARAENKLVLISIGYSACHWCHVMERECFEHEAVAEVMNRHYICIKVDREERPDVDQIYMDAVQLMRGSGGWPLNCFALPDGRPIFGGTYFPRPQWVQVLQDLAAFYEREPAKAEAYAANLTEAIGQLERVVAPAAAPAHTHDDLVRHYIQFEQRIDHQLGGTLGAPKFPVPCNWQWLLRHAELSRAEAALGAVTRTLDAMADGGLYDHIGGGFARYSVDARWHIPHFEKMLYDNGQLVSLYAEAYRATQQPRYAAVVQQTLAFVARELTHPDGGFYSALDADSEGVEGKFYVFTQAEIEAVCGAAAPLITLTYNTTVEGNWEHGLNHLYRSRSDAELAELLGIDAARLVLERAEAEAALLSYRAMRVRPGLDDKVLTSWNALMTRGYVEAYRALGMRDYLDTALRNQHFIERVMAEGPRLNRVWKAGANGGRSSINAYLDDYAFNLEALVALYQATLDPAWLRLAEVRAQYVLDHFTDAETGLCYYTSDLDPPLIARKQDLYDSVTPSGNATLAHALLSLGTLLDRPDWRARSAQMLAALAPLLRQQAGNLSCWAMLQQRMVVADRQVAIVGPEAEAWHRALAVRFRPEVLALGSSAATSYPPLLEGKGAPGQTLAYVCIGQTCRRPVSSLAELEAELSALRQAS